MLFSQSPSYRLYKLSLATGVLFCLPLLLAITWYLWSAFAQIDRYRRTSADAIPWDAELFQLALHDELLRDLRRISLPERPATSSLPTFDLALSRDQYDALNQALYEDGERGYVDGYLQKDGIVHDVKVRYRGDKGWHWLGAQKTMKLKLDKGDLLDGTRVFNLINDPTPFGLEDQIALDIARQLGLLAPEYEAVRVRLNNSDMGVYRYAAQPVEGLLRRGRRMPGAIYSGDTDSIDVKQRTGALFYSRAGWQQVAERSREDLDQFAPLDRLLAAVQGASFAEFATYADAAIDLDRYALFDALDVVFGGNEHDYFSNHKFYFDSYKGKLEPVAWSFRGFRHEPRFNLVDHPLLVRLKMTPGYLARRDRAVFALLTGEASVSNVRARADALFAAMAPELAADPYWDAYKLLPRATRFHRFMVRPMSTAKWLLASRAELHGYSRRAHYLLDQLEQPGLAASAQQIDPKTVRLDLSLSGYAAFSLQRIAVSGPCAGAFSLRADVDRDGQPGAGDARVATGALGDSGKLDAYSDLWVGTRLSARSDASPKLGQVFVERAERRYTYWLSAPCSPSRVTLVLDNQVTGASSRIALAVHGSSTAESPLSPALPPVGNVPSFVAGQLSPHPWDFTPVERGETVHLGPGLVQIDKTRIFSPHQRVEIAAGTRIEMGAGASLVFHGRVTGIGTEGQPIAVVAALSAAPFGGIALQGQHTAGSHLAYWRVEGGAGIGDIGAHYSGLFSIRDTRDIEIENADFSAAAGAEDVLHATYVEDLRLREIHILNAPVDAVDVEFSQGEILGLRVSGAGDDCLDLMGAHLRLADSVLERCTQHAISAGEESDISAHGLFISDSETGVLAKNASRAHIARSFIYRTTTALKTKRRDVHYTGQSSISANELFAEDCDKAIDAAPATRIEAYQVQRARPAQGALDHLVQQVLGLPDWRSFDRYIASLDKKVLP